MKRFSVVTFDCYGTLIDWEEGILSALKPFLARLASPVSEKEVLKQYAQLEKEAEKRWRPYREVLREVFVGLAQSLGFPFSPGEEETLVKSLPSWPPFPEVNETIKGLASRGIPWAIISNIDQDLLEETLRHFDHRPTWTITAEEARAYKPEKAIFILALQKLGTPREEILHVGQSLFHDIAPAKALGLATCWVQRPDRDPFGATPPTQAEPDFVVKDLRQILDLVCQ